MHTRRIWFHLGALFAVAIGSLTEQIDWLPWGMLIFVPAYAAALIGAGLADRAAAARTPTRT